MNFLSLDKVLVTDAVALALSLYDAESACCDALPFTTSPLYGVCRDAVTQQVTEIITKAVAGSIAVTDNGTLAGFLAFTDTDIPGFFGLCGGAYSKLCASAIRDTSTLSGGMTKAKTASMLFTKVSDMLTAEKIAFNQPLNTRISSFALTLFAHDTEVIQSFVLNGFGIRCADAIKKVEGNLFTGNTKSCEQNATTINATTINATTTNATTTSDTPTKNTNTNGYYQIVTTEQVVSGLTDNAADKETQETARGLYELWSMLGAHLEKAPTFFSRWPPTKERFIESVSERGGRFFVFCEDNGKPAGYIQIFSGGENIISETLCATKTMAHVCGTYIKKEYRGKRIAEQLLRFVEKTLAQENITLLGVDCETLNPTALNFWGKYFTNYTYSVYRRIDERCLYCMDS